MKRHRTIITTTALVALTCAAAPPAALAGSLLSGYGGPGEGSQALIGASLVKGPRGGGGGGSSSGSGGRPDLAAAAPASSNDAPDTPVGGSRSRSSGSRAHTGSSGSGSRGSDAGSARTGSSSGQSAQSAGRAEFASYPRSESVAGESSTVAFGASGADLAYIFAALFALLLTAFATLRLARRSGAAGVGAKGISPSIRGHQ